MARRSSAGLIQSVALVVAAVGGVGCWSHYNCIESDGGCADSTIVALVTSTPELPDGHYEVRVEVDGEGFTCAIDETDLAYPHTQWVSLCADADLEVSISLQPTRPASFRIELWNRTPDAVHVELDIPHRPTFSTTAEPSYEEVEGCGYTCERGFAEVDVA